MKSAETAQDLLKQLIPKRRAKDFYPNFRRNQNIISKLKNYPEQCVVLKLDYVFDLRIETRKD